MIRLYGSRHSTAARCLWALEEAGVEYEHVALDVRRGETRSREYLAINPNGRVPALRDGELTLFESMAINLYLARHYDGGLKPVTPGDLDLAIMWSFWAANEVEALVRQLVRNRLYLPPDERSEATARRAEQLLEAPIAILDAHLAERAYLLGDRFSVADVNVGHGFLWLPAVDLDLSCWPRLADWIERCGARPAHRRVHGGSRGVQAGDRIPPGTPDPRGGSLG